MRGSRKPEGREYSCGCQEARSPGGCGLEIRGRRGFPGADRGRAQIVEFRLIVGRGVRRLRRGSPPHAAATGRSDRVEPVAGGQDRGGLGEVSLDLMLRGFFSAGGRLTDLIPLPRRESEAPPGEARPGRQRSLVITRPVAGTRRNGTEIPELPRSRSGPSPHRARAPGSSDTLAPHGHPRDDRAGYRNGRRSRPASAASAALSPGWSPSTGGGPPRIRRTGG